MPVADWTLLDAGIFHDFHVAWVAEIRSALNQGILPEGYYALAEQHASRYIADVLTLHASPHGGERQVPSGGGTLVAESPPHAQRKHAMNRDQMARRRSLAIRHVSGHRLIALIEIVSPSNKDRPESIDDFAAKVVSALDHNVHVLVVDLFPPGLHDRKGMHGEVWQRLGDDVEPCDLPAAEPLTLASYAAGATVEVYLEHVAVGSALPDMALFLSTERYVGVPLEATYQRAYRGMPAYWRDVLEAAGRPLRDG